MTVAELLAEIRGRGVQLGLDGDRVVFRAPRGAFPTELRQALIRRREAVVRALRGAGDRPPEGDLADLLPCEERSEPVAWRVWSRRLDRELWLARDANEASALWAKTRLPVFLLDEVLQLDRKPTELINAIADARAAFGPAGSRIVQ